MNPNDSSDARFNESLNRRVKKSPAKHNPSINEESSQIDKDLEKQVVKLNRYVNTAQTKCQQKKEELSKIKESQEKHEKYLKRMISKMEKKNKTLSEELDKKQELIDKISALFYDVSAQGIDFEQYPDIDAEALKLICGVPPQPSPDKRRMLDPIALRVVEKDQYFADVTNNEEFLDRLNELQRQVSDCKARNRSLSSSLNSMSMSMSPSRNLSKTTPLSSPLRSQLVQDSQDNAKEQSKFAAEFNRLLNEKHALIDQIVEQKKGIKDRNLQYLQEMNSPSKTIIRLSMYNPETRSYSQSYTKTELSASSSPMKH